MKINKNLICEISGGNQIPFYNHFIITVSTPCVWEWSDKGSPRISLPFLVLKTGCAFELREREMLGSQR